MNRPATRVLLVGTGRMGETHAQRFQALPDAEVVAAVDIDATRVQVFCARLGIARAHTNLLEVLQQGGVDAVTVVTPDALHAPATLPCLAAGLPVLCEKPLAENDAQAHSMADAARQAGVVNMVNLSYRTSGALAAARDLVGSGALGELRHVEASYRQSWLVSPYWGDWRTDPAWLWRLSTAHGSQGVLGDIGIHIIDYVLAGSGLALKAVQCRLQNFAKAPGNQLGEYRLDANDSAVISAEFDNGALGTITMSRYATGYQNQLSVLLQGTGGALRFGVGQDEGDQLQVCLGADLDVQRWRAVSVCSQPDTYERFIDAVRGGRPGSPDFAHAAALQAVLTGCLESHATGCWSRL